MKVENLFGKKFDISFKQSIMIKEGNNLLRQLDDKSIIIEEYRKEGTYFTRVGRNGKKFIFDESTDKRIYYC